MQRKTIVLTSVGVLTIIISSVLLLACFKHSVCDLIEQFCMSAIMACIIAIPNTIIATIHDYKQTRRKRLMLIQLLSKELCQLKKDADKSLGPSDKNAQSMNKVDEDVQHGTEVYASNLQSLVTNLTIELSDSYMDNAIYDNLLKEVGACIKATYALSQAVKKQQQPDTTKELASKVKKQCDTCIKIIESIVRTQ